MITLKHTTKYLIFTFISLLILFTLIELTYNAFNLDGFYFRLFMIPPYLFVLRGPYDKVLKTMALTKLRKYEETCKIEDFEDYVSFVGKRYKRVFARKNRFQVLITYYLSCFYASNATFEYYDELREFLNNEPKYNAYKIQFLNIEMLKESIKGDFNKVEDLFIELSYCIDTEVAKYPSDSNQVLLFHQIKLVLSKFVELTHEVTEEGIENARIWINTKMNLYKAIDNYCIVKILEYQNDTKYIDEFKDNIRGIEGNISFLKID